MSLPTSLRFSPGSWLRSILCAPLAAALLHAAPIYQAIADLDANGTIDSRDIQAAIDDMEGARVRYHPGILFLPAGNYVVHAPIVIRRSGIGIKGEGRREGWNLAAGTLLDTRAADATVFIVDGSLPGSDGCRDNSLSDLSILGRLDYADSGGEDPDPFNDDYKIGEGGLPLSPAIRIAHTRFTRVERLRLERTGRGVEVTDAFAPMFANVYAANLADDYCFKFSGSSARACAYPSLSNIITGENTSAIDPTLTALVMEGGVFGLQAHTLKHTGGDHLLVSRRAPAGAAAPEVTLLSKFGVDNCQHDGVNLEHGRRIMMNNALFISVDEGDGLRVAETYEGGLLIANLNIRGCGHHAMELAGGSDFALANACSGGSGIRAANIYAGIAMAAGVRNLRVVGGRVGPPPDSGGPTRQHYGLRFSGTLAEAAAANLGFLGVDVYDDSSDNSYTVPAEPAGLATLNPQP